MSALFLLCVVPCVSCAQESLLWEPESSIAAQIAGGAAPEVLRAKGLLALVPLAASRGDEREGNERGAAGGTGGSATAGEPAAAPVRVLQAVGQVYELTDWVRPVSADAASGSTDGPGASAAGSKMVFVGRNLTAEGLRASLEHAVAAAPAADGHAAAGGEERGQGMGAVSPVVVRAWQV